MAKRYRVDLDAWAPVRITVEVEADDEIDAKQYAVERAPATVNRWELYPTGVVNRIEVVQAEEIES